MTTAFQDAHIPAPAHPVQRAPPAVPSRTVRGENSSESFRRCNRAAFLRAPATNQRQQRSLALTYRLEGVHTLGSTSVSRLGCVDSASFCTTSLRQTSCKSDPGRQVRLLGYSLDRQLERLEIGHGTEHLEACEVDSVQVQEQAEFLQVRPQNDTHTSCSGADQNKSFFS